MKMSGRPDCTYCKGLGKCVVCGRGIEEWHDDGESKIHSWQEPKVGNVIEYSPDGRVIGSEYRTYGQIFKR